MRAGGVLRVCVLGVEVCACWVCACGLVLALVRLLGGVESTTSLRKATILQCRERVIEAESTRVGVCLSISKVLLTAVAAVPVLLAHKWLFPVATSGRSHGVG